VKEWTTGDAHDVTDRTFLVRRALRINDALPGDKPTQNRWVWQRGPWIMVDRTGSHVTALKLPDYDPGVSQVSWFRDYGAYCGLTASGKSVYAVVAQLAARKPLRVTFHPAGIEPASFDLIPGSAVLVEQSDDEADTAPPAKRISKSAG
jgi:hypothetical protein